MTLIRVESGDGICAEICSLEFILGTKKFQMPFGRCLGGSRDVENGCAMFGFVVVHWENVEQLGEIEKIRCFGPLQKLEGKGLHGLI